MAEIARYRHLLRDRKLFMQSLQSPSNIGKTSVKELADVQCLTIYKCQCLTIYKCMIL